MEGGGSWMGWKRRFTGLFKRKELLVNGSSKRGFSVYLRASSCRGLDELGEFQEREVSNG